MPTPRDFVRVSVPLASVLKALAIPQAMPLAQSHDRVTRHTLGQVVQSATPESEDERQAAASYARALRTPPPPEAAAYIRERLASRPSRRRRARSGD